MRYCNEATFLKLIDEGMIQVTLRVVPTKISNCSTEIRLFKELARIKCYRRNSLLLEVGKDDAAGNLLEPLSDRPVTDKLRGWMTKSRVSDS